jgi:hypothetical protein
VKQNWKCFEDKVEYLKAIGGKKIVSLADELDNDDWALEDDCLLKDD